MQSFGLVQHRQEVLSLYFQWVFVSVTAEDHLAAENWSLWHLSIWETQHYDGWKLYSNACIPHSLERTKGVQLGRSCSILSGPLIAVQMLLQCVLACRMFLRFLWIIYLKSNSLSCYGHTQNIDPKPLATRQTAAISFFLCSSQWQQGKLALMLISTLLFHMQFIFGTSCPHNSDSLQSFKHNCNILFG